MHKTLALLGCALAAACTSQPPHDSVLDRIDTIVVIYAENRSFDNLYGTFPGANGVANATSAQKTQLDRDGKPLAVLPPVFIDGKLDPAYPSGLPNGPFRIDAPPVNRGIDQPDPSPVHKYWQSIEQVDGGRNDRFVAMSTVGGWVMGYYDGSSQEMWQWARRYTLADNFFMGAFGGSFLNHQWLACACTPEFRDAPASMRAQLDASGYLKRRPDSPASAMEGAPKLFDGSVTPDGFAVNTLQPAYQPSGIAPPSAGKPELADPARHPLPPQAARTIGDALSEKGVSWAWYADGWREAVADAPHSEHERRVIYNESGTGTNFQPAHQPFNYFARFAPGTAARAEHLKDGAEFLEAIERGTLPHVSFYKPSGRFNEHPEYTDIRAGDVHIAGILGRLEKSPQWAHMLVIVTYDENGGYWDHVPPPSGEGWGDRWGPGSRVPTIIVSPYARRGFVDHTTYDTTSIHKLITRRFGLEPLPGVRRNMGDLTNALAP